MRAQSIIWRLLASMVPLLVWAVCAEEATESIEVVAQTARKSVVVIEAIKDGSISSYGTGFAVGGKNLVVTNAHLLEGCDEALVKSYDSNVSKVGRVIRRSEELDVAILSVPGLEIPPIPLCPIEQVPVGRKVLVIGHPQGLDFTVSDGIVSALRVLTPSLTLLQVTAPISPGSSGGPVMDLHGNAVGIATLFFEQGQNLNFAVPSDAISSILGTINQADVSRVTEEALVQSKSTPTKAADPVPTPSQAATAQPEITSTSSTVAELLERVRTYWRNNEHSNAVLLIGQGLEQFPDDMKILHQAAQFALAEKRFKDGRSYCEKMIKIDPTNGEAHLTYGLLLYFEKDNNFTIARELKKALSCGLNPVSATWATGILCVIVEVEVRGENQQHALDLVRIMLERGWVQDNFLPEFHAYHAGGLLGDGRRSEAEREASTALVLAPTDESLRDLLKDLGFDIDVRVLSFKSDWKQSGLEVTGFVVNDGAEAAPNIKVIVECFDESGELVGTGTGYVNPPDLPAGSTASFSVSVQVTQELSKTHIVRVLRN